VYAVLQPFLAALSEIFGRRELYVTSIVFFLVGSIVCGAAHSYTTFLAGRVLQGVGGAGNASITLMIYADIVPLRQRPKYLNFNNLPWAIGTTMGPLIGGLLVQKSTWRWW
jgi:MFS family permease